MASISPSNKIRPKLVVFDLACFKKPSVFNTEAAVLVSLLSVSVFALDYTLWPFWVDTHVDPPFKKKSNGEVYDRHGTSVEFFPEVPKVLERLKAEGYQIGIASRTSCPNEANSLITLFDWDKYFDYKEIYPGTKTTHFTKFFKASGIKFREMIFFDDEQRNINDLTHLGVLSILVDSDGVTEAVVRNGLKLFVDKDKDR